ncbi:hypothetical protein [Pedobacter ureilyticus]|uniref:DUF4377 domain-containing protein n=1 Tax=Pedobacter ureilyticus TaxID=1393051 RepID=A0ABW9J3V4_9SPHI|nr:hypothetical protein [Pedobacter helvus]
MKINPIYMLVILLALSCDKQDEKAEVQYCNNAKIIKTTCGGTVVQILKPENVGDAWIDASTAEKPTYNNCILLGNIPLNKQKEGSTISIKYQIVSQFGNGNFCDIGGLPPIKASILNIYDSCAD